MANYPDGIPDFSGEIGGVGSKLDQPNHRIHHENVAAELVAIAQELGTNPKGSFDNVRLRLEDLSNQLGATVPRAKAFTSGNPIINSGEVTPLDLGNEAYDTHNLYSETTNPSRITFDRAGLWKVTGQVSYKAHASGGRRMAIIGLNGGEPDPDGEEISRAVGIWDLEVIATETSVTEISVAVNDYVELFAYQDSGANDVEIDSGRTFLQVSYVGP